jgi:hypothetical protein
MIPFGPLAIETFLDFTRLFQTFLDFLTLERSDAHVETHNRI